MLFYFGFYWQGFFCVGCSIVLSAWTHQLKPGPRSNQLLHDAHLGAWWNTIEKRKKKKRKPKVLRSSMHAGWPHTLQQAHKQKDLSKCQPYRVASDPVFQQFGCKWRIQMWKWYKKNFKHLRRYGMMLLFMKWAISSSYSEFDSPINLSYITLRISVL